MKRLARRTVLGLLAAAPLAFAGGVARAQQSQAPRVGRYRVYRATANTRLWIRDLVIENASEYAVYESNKGAFYGRGTFSFDGTSARFLTGPFYDLGYRGSSLLLQDGRHYLRLGNSVEAFSEN